MREATHVHYSLRGKRLDITRSYTSRNFDQVKKRKMGPRLSKM